jgi:hypothetical protein
MAPEDDPLRSKHVVLNTTLIKNETNCTYGKPHGLKKGHLPTFTCSLFLLSRTGHHPRLPLSMAPLNKKPTCT